jgi:hypothetical protein
MKLFNYLPVVLVLAHTAMVLLIACVASLGPEGAQLWGLVVLIDFPISILASPLISALELWSQRNCGVAMTYSVVFAILYGTVGAIQYYLMGILIRRAIRMNR